MEEKTKYIKGAKLEFFPPPGVPGYGNASGFELRLLDKTGKGVFKQMEGVVNKFIIDLKARPEIASAITIFKGEFCLFLVTRSVLENVIQLRCTIYLLIYTTAIAS